MKKYIYNTNFVFTLFKLWYKYQDFQEALDDTKFLFNNKVQNELRELLKDFKLK